MECGISAFQSLLVTTCHSVIVWIIWYWSYDYRRLTLKEVTTINTRHFEMSAIVSNQFSIIFSWKNFLTQSTGTKEGWPIYAVLPQTRWVCIQIVLLLSVYWSLFLSVCLSLSKNQLCHQVPLPLSVHSSFLDCTLFVLDIYSTMSLVSFYCYRFLNESLSRSVHVCNLLVYLLATW